MAKMKQNLSENIYEIPEPTQARNLKIQEAAHWFIYRRFTNLKSLAAKVDCHYGSLVQAASEDKWVEFAAKHRAKEIGGVNIQSLARSEGELARIEAENELRPWLGQQCVEERRRCVALLETMDPTTKQYASVVTAIARLNALIERFTGLDSYLAELSAVRTTICKRGGSPDVPPEEDFVDIDTH